MTFQKRLVELRTQITSSPGNFAKSIGIFASDYCSYENGDKLPTPRELGAICKQIAETFILRSDEPFNANGFWELYRQAKQQRTLWGRICSRFRLTKRAG